MIKVRVPATSANVGPGFDALGIALNLYNNLYFEEIENGLVIEGCDQEFANENNLIYVSMKKCFERIGYDFKGIKIKIEDNIPISRGLGSSAACIVGGIAGANGIAGNVLNEAEMLKLATEIEGHPDNVTPALLGGMTVSVSQGKEVYYSRIQVAKGLKFYALIPNFRLSTEKARAVLPKTIDYKDGVFNVGRVSLLISALVNGEFDLIKIGCRDKLHQNYRGKLIEGFEEIKSKCEELGCYGVFLSGAGPTIMAMVDDKDHGFYKDIEGFLKTLEADWKVKALEIDDKGCVIEEY